MVDKPKLSLHHHSTAAILAGPLAAKQQALSQLAGQQQRQSFPKGTGVASGPCKLPLQTKAKAADDDKDAHIVQLEVKVRGWGARQGLVTDKMCCSCLG